MYVPDLLRGRDQVSRTQRRVDISLDLDPPPGFGYTSDPSWSVPACHCVKKPFSRTKQILCVLCVSWMMGTCLALAPRSDARGGLKNLRKRNVCCPCVTSARTNFCNSSCDWTNVFRPICRYLCLPLARTTPLFPLFSAFFFLFPSFSTIPQASPWRIALIAKKVGENSSHS